MCPATAIVVWSVLCLMTTHSVTAQTFSADDCRALLKYAEDWHVPQPAAKSQLVKIQVFRSGTTDFHALGFVDPAVPGVALVGFDNWTLTGEFNVIADPDSVSLDDVAVSSPFRPTHGVNFGLLTGLQLFRGGHEKTGLDLINKALAKDAGHHRSPFYSPAGEPPVRMLARACLAASMNEVTSSKPDFTRIKQRMERLLADQPSLRSEELAGILQSLEANVARPPSPAGSIERIIDEYLLSGQAESDDVGLTSAERALILKGFQAVPALLAQRHSMRYTNFLAVGFNNVPSSPRTAGEVIQDYLQRLANCEFESSWIDQIVEKDPDPMVQWWKKAKTLGEQAYVKKFTINFDRNHECRFSHQLLVLSSDRYPALLPDFYLSLLKSSGPSWLVGDAIVKCPSISQDRKIELLRQGIVAGHRYGNFDLLRELKPDLADEFLRTFLKQASGTALENYWIDPDARLARDVAQSTDPRVWRELLALLNRADLGMRMELIYNLHPPQDAPAEIRQLFHRIYVTYRDDMTVRDILSSEKFSGPAAGFEYKQLAMRDFIRLRWARCLRLNVKPPSPNATDDEWTAFRQTVDLAISRGQGDPNGRHAPHQVNGPSLP
ncbi:MAG: hypothetical protein JSS49_10130 [Planctomycetes bacterium]|nr:hypothetical protein [Planctomycetota bacterium]